VFQNRGEESLADLPLAGLAQHLLELETHGDLTREDLLAVWHEMEDAPETRAELWAVLEQAGLSPEELDLEGLDAAVPAVHLKHHFYDLTGIESDDTVSLYLREVGNIPLLTAQQEVDLAQRIERGQGAVLLLAAGTADGERETLRALVADGEAARHHLTKANSRLVIAMAKKYMNQGVPFLDLIQEGNLGLMKAVEKFDWRRGFKFSTYATWWVRQAITRAIADQGRTIRVPVHMSDRIRRLFQVSRQLEQALGREPTIEEVAAKLELPPKKVQWMLRIARSPLSLEKPVGEEQDSELGDFIEDDEFPAPSEAATYTLLRDEIELMLTALPPREARVLELRFGLLDGRTHTLKEVGEKFGVTRERIRQIETEALDRLRHLHRASRLRSFLEVD
jgi:RNA polymerase primary sigma factor